MSMVANADEGASSLDRRTLLRTAAASAASTAPITAQVQTTAHDFWTAAYQAIDD